MATWDDVRRLALALPETSEQVSREQPSWRVRDKSFAWERSLRPADLRALGDAATATRPCSCRWSGSPSTTSAS
jgi:hypothetical protein